MYRCGGGKRRYQKMRVVLLLNEGEPQTNIHDLHKETLLEEWTLTRSVLLLGIRVKNP